MASIASIASAPDDPMARSLLTQLMCVKSAFEEALDLLSTSSLPQACRLSNASYLHFRMGKPSLAILYAAKALKAKARDAEGGGGSAFAMLYHAASFMLQEGKATQAALCYQHSAPLYHNNPLLWLRVAECCNYLQNCGELIPWKGSAEGQLSLGAARTCLRNALRLVSAGKGDQWRHVQELACANLAYVELSLRDYKAAKEGAENLLTRATCPEIKSLAHGYLAEALFWTAKPHEALKHALEAQEEERRDLSEHKDSLHSHHIGGLAGNVASIMSLMGDAKKAEQTLEESNAGLKGWGEKLSCVHVSLLNGHNMNETLALLGPLEEWGSDVKTTK